MHGRTLSCDERADKPIESHPKLFILAALMLSIAAHFITGTAGLK
jgi:hypothetical protein